MIGFFGFLGFIFIIIIVVVIIGLVFVSTILSSILRIFGIGKKRTSRRETYTRSDNNGYGNNPSNEDNSANSNSQDQKSKIISDDEGEYVDYQEIK